MKATVVKYANKEEIFTIMEDEGVEKEIMNGIMLIQKLLRFGEHC